MHPGSAHWGDGGADLKEKKALKIFIIILSCITVLTLICMPMMSVKADYADSVDVGAVYEGGTNICCEEGRMINATFLSSSYSTLSYEENTQNFSVPEGKWIVNSKSFDADTDTYTFTFTEVDENTEPIEAPLADENDVNEPMGDGTELLTEMVTPGAPNNSDALVTPFVSPDLEAELSPEVRPFEVRSFAPMLLGSHGPGEVPLSQYSNEIIMSGETLYNDCGNSVFVAYKYFGADYKTVEMPDNSTTTVESVYGHDYFLLQQYNSSNYYLNCIPNVVYHFGEDYQYTVDCPSAYQISSGGVPQNKVDSDGVLCGDNKVYEMTFVNWNTAEDLSGSNYSDGDCYSETGTLDLYAAYSGTVEYNPNYGSGFTNTVKSDSVYYIKGQNITLKDYNTLFTKPSGFSKQFVGWSYSADTEYTDTANLVTGSIGYSDYASKVSGGKVVLYAIYRPITYKVCINDGSTKLKEYSVTGDDTLTINSADLPEAKTGYKYKKLTTLSDGTGTNYNFGTSYSYSELGSQSDLATLDLYVSYEPIQYRIELYSCGNKYGHYDVNYEDEIILGEDYISDGERKKPYLMPCFFETQTWDTSSEAESSVYYKGQKLKHLSSTDNDTIKLYYVYESLNSSMSFSFGFKKFNKDQKVDVYCDTVLNVISLYEIFKDSAPNGPFVDTKYLTGKEADHFYYPLITGEKKYDFYALRGKSTTSGGAVMTVIEYVGIPTLYYDSNGGSGGMTPSSDFIITNEVYDDVVNNRRLEVASIVSGNNFTPPTGKQFKCFNTKPDGTGTSYNPGDKVATDKVSLTLYAIWEPLEYYVCYVTNGGQWKAGFDPNTYTIDHITYGDPVDLPDGIKDNISYTGHKFKYWVSSSDHKSLIEDGAVVTNNFDNDFYRSEAGGSWAYHVELSPLWEPIKYKIKYHNNLTVDVIDTVDVEYSDSYKELKANSFTNGNWQFMGWSDNSNSNVVKYTDRKYGPALSTTENDVIDLYAVWKGSIQYKYDNNQTITKEVYWKTDSLESTAGITKENYTLQGWTDDAAHKDTVKYALGANIRDLELPLGSYHSVVLYPVWKADTFKVHYYANSGSGPSMPEQEMEIGKATKLNACTYSPATGKKFLGWDTNQYKTGTPTYSDKQTVTLPAFKDSIFDLYAIWGPISYNIKFNPNGGSAIASGDTVTVNYDSTYTIPDFNLTREGYTFIGWSKEPDANKYEVIGTTGTTLTNLTASDGVTVNLYAKWKPNSVENLSSMNGKYLYSDSQYYIDKNMKLYFYDANQAINGGIDNVTSNKMYKIYTDLKNNNTGVTVQKYVKWYFIYDSTNNIGSFYGIPSIEYDPNKGSGTMNRTEGLRYSDVSPYDRAHVAECVFTPPTGYHFKEWNSKADGKGDVYVAYTDAFATNNSNYTQAILKLYAIWEPNVYNVKYDANTGIGTMAIRTNIPYDKEIMLDANTFTKEDYSFKGWALTPDAKDVNYKNYGKVKNLTPKNGETVTLYAIWARSQVHIVYNSNGGEGDKMPDTIAKFNEPVNLTANSYKKSGSIFMGWSTDKKAKNPMYVNGALIKDPVPDKDGNYILYAIWKNTVTPTPMPTPKEEIQPAGGKDKPKDAKKDNKEDKKKDKGKESKKETGEKKVYNISPTPVVEDPAQIIPANKPKTEFDEKSYLIDNSTKLDANRQKITLSEVNVLVDDQELFLKAVERLVGKEEKAALTGVFCIDYYEKNDNGEWQYVEKTDKLYRITLDIPEGIKSDDAEYCLIMKNGNVVTLVIDLDDNPDTITIAVSEFDAQYMMLGVNDLDSCLSGDATTFSNSGIVIDVDNIEQSTKKREFGLKSILIVLGIAAELFVLIYLFKTRLYPYIKKKRDD